MLKLYTLLLILNLFFETSAFHTRKLPDGDYQNTCTSCSLIDSQLKCKCLDDHSHENWTNLELPCEYDEKIINNWGKLACAKESQLPHGSYKETCKPCNILNDTLICKCQTRNKTLKEARFEGKCNNIEEGLINKDGALICNPSKLDTPDSSSTWKELIRKFYN